ncbi:MAG: hypothetical protein M3450_07015 [Actinomycetota bacterium]|nr:hypothetical protein [Actinomycetota bacterium]
MAALDERSDDHGGAPVLFLLFAGRHDRPAGSTGSLVAAFASGDEARAAFRQARLGLSDSEGWAELTMVADGAGAKRVCWFGQDRRRRDQPVLLLATDGSGVTAAGSRAPKRHRSFRHRLLRRGDRSAAT